MADKNVGELIAAQSVTPTDLFVLEQNGTAKKLTGQTLENWLVSFADGHGGIQSITKISTDVLADTYRITLSDTTVYDFIVTNGRSVNSIEKTFTSGLVDTYTISYNDGTTSTFTVTNGAKGDQGDNAYIWVKYASQEPTSSSVSLGDIPDDWMGVYFGTSDTAPTSYSEYKWYQIKGEKGDTGAPATLVSSSVTYQAGNSGTIIPSGTWSASIPVVAQGKYLWTREVTQFNTGNPITKYSVSRMGIDGLGSVVSVDGVSPDENGNVDLIAEDVGALPIGGGTMEGPINMNGQTLSGLNAPTEDDHAANMGFVNEAKTEAVNYAKKVGNPRNHLDDSDFTNPVNQRGNTVYEGFGHTLDRWFMWNEEKNGVLTVQNGYITIETANLYQRLEKVKDNMVYTFAVKFVGEDPIVISGNFVEGATNGKITLHVNTEGNPEVAITPGNVEWAALYEGEYTAETLPPYVPKGYGAELAECQRYFYKSPRRSIYSGYFTGSSKEFISATIDGLCKMRTIPTVSASGSVVVRTLAGYSSAEGFTTGNGGDVSLLSGINMYSKGSIRLGFNSAATDVNNSPGVVTFVESIYFSADL